MPRQPTRADSAIEAAPLVTADDRAAQLGVAVETISDELEGLLGEVRELRADLAELRVALDRLGTSA